MGYYKPCSRDIKPGQRFGANPGWGPNPPGGHNGNDELAPVGTPVFAAGDGVVVFAGRFDSTYADNWGWNLNFGGQMVVLNLDGPDGPYVEYGHNSELRVKTGDRVTGGQVIALSGEDDGGTHVITGPHVHVGVLPPNFDLSTPTYGRVNPDLYLTEYWSGTLSLASTGSITTQGKITPTSEEDDMFSDSDRAALARIDQKVDPLPSGNYWTDMINAMARVDQRTWEAPGKQYWSDLINAMARVDASAAAGADPAALAQAISEALPAKDANALLDALAERLRSK